MLPTVYLCYGKMKLEKKVSSLIHTYRHRINFKFGLKFSPLKFNIVLMVMGTFRGQKPVGSHETLMIVQHETFIDFYGASERWI